MKEVYVYSKQTTKEIKDIVTEKLQNDVNLESVEIICVVEEDERWTYKITPEGLITKNVEINEVGGHGEVMYTVCEYKLEGKFNLFAVSAPETIEEFF